MTINYDDIKPFEYHQAAFFVGLPLELITDLVLPESTVTYKPGRRFYVYSVVDFGQGCLLELYAIASKGRDKRIGYFDTSNFYQTFRPTHFYP